MSHGTRMNESRTHVKMSCHVHEWEVPSMRMSHVTHMNELCPTRECGIAAHRRNSLHKCADTALGAVPERERDTYGCGIATHMNESRHMENESRHAHN